MRRPAGHILPKEQNLAAARRQNTGDEVEQRGLPRPIGTKNAHAVSRMDLQGDILDSLQSPKLLGESVQGETWRGAALPDLRTHRVLPTGHHRQFATTAALLAMLAGWEVTTVHRL